MWWEEQKRDLWLDTIHRNFEIHVGMNFFDCIWIYTQYSLIYDCWSQIQSLSAKLTDETDQKFILVHLKFSWTALNERPLFQWPMKLVP